MRTERHDGNRSGVDPELAEPGQSVGGAGFKGDLQELLGFAAIGRSTSCGRSRGRRDVCQNPTGKTTMSTASACEPFDQTNEGIRNGPQQVTVPEPIHRPARPGRNRGSGGAGQASRPGLPVRALPPQAPDLQESRRQEAPEVGTSPGLAARALNDPSRLCRLVPTSKVLPVDGGPQRLRPG